MRMLDEFLEFLLMIGLPLIFFGGGIFLIIYGIDRYDCYGFEQATAIRTEFRGVTCYALVDGKWLPKKYVFGDAHELRLK